MSVDLRQLAIERPAGAPPSKRSRHFVARYLLPVGILVAFTGLLAWAAREQLVRATPVTVVPVVVTRADVQQSGEPLFQAPGWIEPRPSPVYATALAPGVVEDLLVVEGQEVEAGQPIARLIDVDSKLLVQRAEADLKLREAELASAEADLEAAQTRLQYPVHLEAELAEAESLLAESRLAVERLPFQIRAAQSRVDYAQQNLEGKQAAGEAVSGRLVQEARSEYQAALAALEELQQLEPQLRERVQALERKRQALSRRLELLTEESRELASARARVQAALANRDQARVALEQARLELDRMVVRSPITGRVLQLIASPGIRVTGMGSEAEHSGTAVVTLYDPQRLQVRADVRLEDVPLVTPGQPVRIETASANQPIDGVVLYSTSSANVQKNTLEVKVALHDPPPTVRPEMLVTATFLAPEQPAGDEESTPPQRLLVPRDLVDQSEDQAFVWVADSGDVARRRPVQLGRASSGDLVEVSQGLQPTDRLIVSGRENVRDGERIQITGEDNRYGEA